MQDNTGTIRHAKSSVENTFYEEIVSLSLVAGFDRIIYLHNITNKLGYTVEYPAFMIH